MSLSTFTNRYQLSKTLRFELIPQGKTLEHIQQKELLTQDEKRAESYKKMKETIDGFHKYFIELAMHNVRLSHLEAYKGLYFASPERKKEEKYKDELKKVQEAMRKEIANGFKTGEAKEIFSKIDKKELITELLKNWVRKHKQEDVDLVESFKDFTTYFGGFHENRKNMYTDKEQSTAIAFRLVHENLPKFLDNIRTFERIKEIPELYEKCKELYQNIEVYLNIASIDEAFELTYYNEVLTQKQIGVYNLIVGGRVAEEGKPKIKGLNEYINTEYNQKQTDKNKRIPKLKMLYKQILSDRENTSFIAEKFEDSEEVLDAINEYYHHYLISFLPKEKEDTENVLKQIQSILQSVKEYDLSKIYIRNDKSLTDISKMLYGDWGVIGSALEFTYLQTLEIGKKGLSKTQEAEKKHYLKQDYFSIAEIEKALYKYRNEAEVLNDLTENDSPVADYFRTHFKVAKKEDSDKEFDFVSYIDARYSCIKGVLENYPAGKKLHQDKKTIDDIKLFLDALMELLHFVKPLVLPSDSTLEKDNIFYGQLEVWYEQLALIVPLYNKVRNYATQKPYSVEKFKLNFENKGQFLGGWVDSHTDNSDNGTQAGGYLFRKKNEINEYDYYLGISADVKLFRLHKKDEIKYGDKSEFERLDYYQLKSASVYGNSYVCEEGESYEKDKNSLFNAIKNFGDKTNPVKDDFEKYINSQKGDNRPTPSGLINILKDKYPQVLNNLMNDDSFKKENNKVTQRLKDTILSLSRVPKSQAYKTTNFTLFTEPIQVIDELSKEKTFSYFPVSDSEFNEACNRNDKPLLLFKIRNKDLSFAETYNLGKRKIEKRGKDNLHTLYFKALMQGDQNVFDIGTGEVFFRKKSITSNIVVHQANESIDNKNPLNTKKKSTFDYDITKDKRYTFDKFQFHLSMIMNYQEDKKPKEFELEVNKYLKNNPDVHIIGIDRGERHLIYISLIDQKGNILHQETLNSIINEKHNIVTPYHTLLAKKEEERDKARKNWGTIENIKELKEGYLSQVVHKIAKMMVEYNAIVVMEDLNFEFKRGRFKIEKQVYQKLEKMLIDKLNFLVFKDREPHQIGGLYKALQLTSKFSSFKNLGKQSGFLFYVPAWNTSKIDPVTGFVNLFDTRYESIDKAKDFFEKFKSIRYNGCKGYFEFSFDYNDFTSRADGTKTDWVVCTFGERILTFRNPDANNQWDSKEVKLTDQLEDLFRKYNIFYGDGADLRKQIAGQEDAQFFKLLLNLFKLTLQMRNSKTGTEIDYLISPVMNEKGVFYDSRNADASLPKDADANGAYHIAKKGLWVLEQINQTDDLKKVKLAISNKEWLRFVQK